MFWKPWGWAVLSNDVAVENARTAAVEISRRRLERAEVELFLAARRDDVTKSATA